MAVARVLCWGFVFKYLFGLANPVLRGSGVCGHGVEGYFGWLRCSPEVTEAYISFFQNKEANRLMYTQGSKKCVHCEVVTASQDVDAIRPVASIPT